MKYESTAVVIAVMVFAAACSAHAFAAENEAGKPNPAKAAIAKSVGKVRGDAVNVVLKQQGKSTKPEH